MQLYKSGPGVSDYVTMMMKLPLLLVLFLLALSSASQFIINNSFKNVSILNPATEDRTHDITSNRTKHRFILSSPTLRKRRFTQRDSPNVTPNSNLKWLTWNGSLPNGSVSIYNKYVGRIDYICKYKCEAGFYNPNKGPYCHYPYGDKEVKGITFEILVNKDNFDILEWKDGSYGSVPQDSVRTCVSRNIYVGKNKYGLGKVHAKHKAFFIPWEGKEYWYKYYQVLTFNSDVSSEHISNVKYITNRAEIIQQPPETMQTSTSTNYECNSVSKTVALSKTDRVEKRWDISASLMGGIRKTFTGGVPSVASSSVEVSLELTLQFSGGHTVTEETSHSINIELKVPPNHDCRVRMEAYKYKINVPFTAHLSRTYSNGETTWTLISGTYNSVQIGDLRSVVERCEPTLNAKPCPQGTPQNR